MSDFITMVNRIANDLTRDDLTAEIKQAMVRAAKEVVVGADGSKIGNVAAAHVAPLSSVDRLITDTGADPRELERIRKSGVDVTVV